MIKFKELIEKTQSGSEKTNNHVKIANEVVEEFLKSEDGINLHNEIESIHSDEDEN